MKEIKTIKKETLNKAVQCGYSFEPMWLYSRNIQEGYEWNVPSQDLLVNWLNDRSIAVWAQPTVKGWIGCVSGSDHGTSKVRPIKFNGFSTHGDALEGVILEGLKTLRNRTVPCEKTKRLIFDNSEMD